MSTTNRTTSPDPDSREQAQPTHDDAQGAAPEAPQAQESATGTSGAAQMMHTPVWPRVLRQTHIHEREQLRRARRLAQGPAGELEPVDLDLTLAHEMGLPSTIKAGWRDNHHAVWVGDEHADEWDYVTHLWVRRHDGKPIRSWAAMQRIKDRVTSPNRVAIEVYPAQRDIVDSANMYHLWVLPDGVKLSFGLKP